MLRRCDFARVTLIYSDPQSYVSGQSTQFTKGPVESIGVLPGFAGLHAMSHGAEDCLIIGAGYDHDLVRAVAQRLAHKRRLSQYSPSQRPRFRAPGEAHVSFFLCLRSCLSTATFSLERVHGCHAPGGNVNGLSLRLRALITVAITLGVVTIGGGAGTAWATPSFSPSEAAAVLPLQSTPAAAPQPTASFVTPTPIPSPAPATSASAAKVSADITGPIFISGSVDKTTVSPSTGDKTITVTVKASDPSGVSTPTISASSNETDQSAGFGGMDLAAGTATNGTWKRTITFPATAAPGTWTIDLFPLKDSLGNGVGGFRTIATITVTAKAPTISAGSVKVTGTAKVGAILTAAPSSWPAGTTFRYSWSADGTVIAGENAKTFVPTAGVVGKKITVRVTGSLAGYSSSSKTSAATNPVTKATLTSAPPTISGAAKVGSTLTAKAGTWTSGAALRYQWFAGAQPIAGATSATFVPKAAHVGSRLSVRVTGTLQGYVNKVETSAPTRPVTR